MTTLRVVWPIVDEALPYSALIVEAIEDLPDVATRHRARLTGAGRFWIARSVDVPGSGRVTPTVLLFEAPAEPAPRRHYWLPTPEGATA